MFLFDSYGEGCRVPIVPENFDQSLLNREGEVSITLEQGSGSLGKLAIIEDHRDPGLGETLSNWFLSTLADVGDGPEVDEEAFQ